MATDGSSSGPLTVGSGTRAGVLAGAALVTVLAVGWAAWASRAELTWVVLGTLAALALDPVVSAVRRRAGLGRGPAVAVVAGAAGVAVVLVVLVVLPYAVDQVSRFGQEVPAVAGRLGEAPLIGGWLQAQQVPEKLTEWLSGLPERLARDERPLLEGLRSAAAALVAAGATVAVAVAALVDGPRLVRSVRRAVPEAHRATYDLAVATTYRTVGRYFAGSLLVAGLAGASVLVVGLLAGVPLAPLAAAWVTLTNLVPQIGGFLGGAVFVALGFAAGPTQGLVCLAFFLVYQQVENNVLQPTIVGQTVDLSPPITMVAALIGGSAFGVAGALVAIPLLGAAKGFVLQVRRAQGLSPPPRESPPPSGVAAAVRRLGRASARRLGRASARSRTVGVGGG